MKAFTDIVINTDQCRREILAFHDFLAGTADLSEKKDILPFFRKSPQLSAYCGYYNPKSIVCDSQEEFYIR